MKEAWQHLIGRTLEVPQPEVPAGAMVMRQAGRLPSRVQSVRAVVFNKPKRRRRPSLARIARLATKAGVEIKIEPDGSIVVMPKEGEAVSPDLNPWLEEIKRITKQ
jgi:hypothetical protein